MLTPCTLLILSSVSIAPDDVYVKLHNLDPNKSAGPVNWPTRVLKDMAEQLCLPLTILFTKSIQTSTLPDAWERGHMIPIHKKVTVSMFITTVP